MNRTLPPHGFPHAEFEHRFTRFQAILREHRLDGVFITTPQNFRYFTGFATEFWESPTRPWFTVLPAQGQPTAVIPELGAATLATTWVQDIRTWPAPVPEDDGVSLLAAALRSLPRTFGRVGAELGREMYLRMSVADYLRLPDLLPGIELVDGAAAIWQARMIKTAGEVERIRAACQLACDSFDQVPTIVRRGMSEREAVRAIRSDATQRGVDAIPFMPGVSGPEGVAQIIAGPGDRELAEGDVFFVDTGMTYDGYFCDFDRNFAVGRPSPACAKAHEAVWQATEAGIAAVRPGVTTEDIWRVMSDMLAKSGALGNSAGRLGHGLGLQLTEPPSHRQGDRTVIREGMVLTIEPGMEYAPGKSLVHEENVVVRADGAELLTRRAPRELPVIG
ncbi:MAG: Xaa-Pro peptidase family protein [Hyphomicrobiales bacterium]